MDKVKLHAQERLDLDDTRALQTLVYDYVQEALGGLMGHMRGSLSAPTITQTENNGAPYIELSKFQFATSTPVESSAVSTSSPSSGLALNQYKNIIVSYDPNEETTTQISIDTIRAYYQDYIGAYLWARPTMVDTDTATRVKWDVSQGAEVTFSDDTRESQRVQFAISLNEPVYSTSTEAKWAPIARLDSFSNGDNTNSLAEWQIISAFEHDDARTFMGTVSGDQLARNKVTFDYMMDALPLYPMNSGRSYRSLGLADQIAILRYKIAQMQGYGTNDPSDTPTNRNWYLPPLISLNGVYTDLYRQQTERTSRIVCIASVEISAQYIDSTGDYEYLIANTGTRIGVEDVRASTLRQNRVSIELTSTLLAQPWYVLHVGCTQYMYRTGSNNMWDYNRVNFQVAQVASKLNNTAEYRLDDYATTSGRGITVELLPLYTTNEEAIDDQHDNHNHVNFMGSEGAQHNGFVKFSVAVFAIHEQ